MRAWMILVTVVLGCTASTGGSDEEAATDTEVGPTSASGTHDDADTHEDTDSPSDTSTGSSATDGATDGATTTSTTSTTDPDDGDTTDTGPGAEPGCPDPLPPDWVLCEDFEGQGDPYAYFGHFTTTAGLLAVEAADAWSGERALRVGHDPAIFGSGMADIRFGEGPSGGTIHAPDETFREVWVRFHLRTQDGWPDAGIAEAVEVVATTGELRAIAVDATIYSPTQVEAQALAWSCVHGSQLLCNGQGDWTNPNLEVRDGGLGTSALYGSAAAGQWQCHEIHVRLDDPGQGNGQFDVSVDGSLEVALDGLTLVDGWDDVGLNTVRFASYWNAPANLEHFIDDVVVSTSPIGCP